MVKLKYFVVKKEHDAAIIANENLWRGVNEALITSKSYLWVNNNYTPKVIVKIFHTKTSIYVKFKVFEKKVRIKRINIGDEVWKDSCVEFFLNPFPQKSKEYFNIEINALGIPLVGVGENGDDEKRYYFNENEIDDWVIIPSIKTPIDGEIIGNHWTLHYKIPKLFFENYYGEKFNKVKGIANFYKCGDETEFVHFGAWNKVKSPEPNFHQPKYFGEINFI